jgi:hypothetical protein
MIFSARSAMPKASATIRSSYSGRDSGGTILKTDGDTDDAKKDEPDAPELLRQEQRAISNARSHDNLLQGVQVNPAVSASKSVFTLIFLSVYRG